MNVGLFTAVKGLQVAQRQLDVAGHNVANADTPGYSRQRVDQTASTPQTILGGYAGKGDLGLGVDISQIKRVKDQFIDRQLRAESAPLGEAQVKSSTLRQIEDIYNEPSDQGLQALMQRFFDSWQSLSQHPENAAMRIALRQNAVNLAAGFQEVSQKLQALRQDLNDRMASTVNDINSMTAQAASLNTQIKASISAGQNPNDLLDKQDLLFEQLSQQIKIQVVESPSSGTRSAYIGGQPLVADETAYTLSAVPVLLSGFTQLQYTPTGDPAVITGGALKGLVDSRDVILSDTLPQGNLTQLNDLANGMITAINALHTTGFGPTGVTTQNFFDGTDASDIVVNANILNDTVLANGLDVIAAAANDPTSLAGGVGDNAIAVAIAQLKNAKLMATGTLTFDDHFKGIIASVGTQAQEEMRKVDTQELLVASVKERRDQASGVSTDEEMANVIRFQKAYAASARILTAIDEMLDRLMNVGLVGR